MREKLVVVVPCLNEERSIVETVEGILAVAPSLPVEVEVLMVDDGSKDRTVDRMADLCSRFPGVKYVVNNTNLGVGRSIMNAWATIQDGTWVTVFPGDNEMPFESIRAHLAVRDRYDVVLGFPANPVARTLTRRMASSSFMQVTRFLYGFPYQYLNGIKLYRVEAFKGLDVLSSGHAFNAELLAKAMLRKPDLRVGEVPFVWRGRSHGTSRAVRPASILKAVREVALGFRSVAEFRSKVLGRDDER